MLLCQVGHQNCLHTIKQHHVNRLPIIAMVLMGMDLFQQTAFL